MKILKLKFEDKTTNWKIDSLEFDNFVLLVGASGVGKTQILKSILKLKDIADGKSFNGIKWYIEFEDLSKNKYIWEGEFERTKHISEFDEDYVNNIIIIEGRRHQKINIISENIFYNNKEIVNRLNNNLIYFGVDQHLKLSPYLSIISLLQEENIINEIYENFKNILFNDYAQPNYSFLINNTKRIEQIKKQYTDLQAVIKSKLNILTKLYVLTIINDPTLKIILSRFKEIFPQVEDVKIEMLNLSNANIPDDFQEPPLLHIKEVGIEQWIYNNISSGMYRTLLQLAELYLSAEGTVFLIDEFENSLGINCINEITNDILNTDRQLQFIFTSHHPYIINSIDMKYWKLITRNAGVVKSHKISEFIKGKSKHDAFMQLIQLEEYQTGREKE